MKVLPEVVCFDFEKVSASGELLNLLEDLENDLSVFAAAFVVVVSDLNLKYPDDFVFEEMRALMDSAQDHALENFEGGEAHD